MTNPPKEPALEDRAPDGEKLFSPSAARNRDPIREAFLKTMPHQGRILEIGAGTGEHAVHMARALPDVSWHVSDPDEKSRRSIAAWMADSALANLFGPYEIDVIRSRWGVESLAPFSGMVSLNMIHIAPFAAAEGLFAGAGRLLGDEGQLFLYGPFSRNGAHIAESNERFDASLKARDPRWGVRDLDLDIVPLAQKNSLRLEAIVEMPANNLAVIFVKTP